MKQGKLVYSLSTEFNNLKDKIKREKNKNKSLKRGEGVKNISSKTILQSDIYIKDLFSWMGKSQTIPHLGGMI